MSATGREWDGLTDEEHEWHFNPQRAMPTFRDSQARREPLNQAARAVLPAAIEIAYGPDPQETFDLYRAPGPAPAPVHMFFHGGYWRAQDKANFAFIAAPLVACGVTALIVNYPLCPRVTLDDVVAAALRSVDWVVRNIAWHGGDPARLTICGHSAGAHLCAAILAEDWSARGLVPDPVKGALLISGIYDPLPARRTSVNADLHLTEDQIARHDYERIPPVVRCPVWVVAGGAEPWHWIGQSLRYGQHLRRHGIDAGILVQPSFHHFDIIDQFPRPESDLARCLDALLAER